MYQVDENVQVEVFLAQQISLFLHFIVNIQVPILWFSSVAIKICINIFQQSLVTSSPD